MHVSLKGSTSANIVINPTLPEGILASKKFSFLVVSYLAKTN